MADLIQGIVGHFDQRSGAGIPALDRRLAIKFMQAGGCREDAVDRGNVYIGANPAGTPVVFQAGLSATTPPLTLYNPVGSGVRARLLTVTLGITTNVGASGVFMLAYNTANATPPATTTAATVTPARVGTSKTGLVQCYRVATLAAAPVACRYIGGQSWGSAVGISPYVIIDKVDGEIELDEGVALSIQSTVATVAGLVSFAWDEVPKS